MAQNRPHITLPIPKGVRAEYERQKAAGLIPAEMSYGQFREANGWVEEPFTWEEVREMFPEDFPDETTSELDGNKAG